MKKALIKNCKNLERKAQREMFDHLSPLLFPTCMRYAHSFEDAKDLLQESLILIFNNMHKCQSEEIVPFKSWCKRITINNALTKIRKANTYKESFQEEDLQECSLPTIYSKLNMEDILKMLNVLPERHRHVFNLSILDGYTHKEIAELLSIKESSSRTLLVRARQALQRMIQNESIPIENKGSGS